MSTTAAQRHPRRSPSPTVVTPSATAAETTTALKTNMSLRKGATFHSSPTSPSPASSALTSTTSTASSSAAHLGFTPSLPRRAQSTLDDVVDAHKRRVALTLGDIDRGLAADDSSSASPSASSSFRDDALPGPSGVISHTVGAAQSYGPIMDHAVAKAGRPGLRPRVNRRPARFSDSALGSSIDDSSSGKKAPTTTGAASAITRSAASSLKNTPALSARAANRIREHVLRPLLAKPALRDFHSIVRDVPRRIHDKEIVCLRDLEKTLVFMAPERAKSAALYLDFCLTSIYCIQATVDFLSDREQTRPSDRPYTSGYFVDLVDQIRQYAQQVQAAKEKEADGEALDDADPKSTDEIKLHGGLTKNGRPAELVRVRADGKTVSIATGLPVDADEEDSKGALHFKRSLSQELEDDEAILRSMARRKRSASAAELAPKRCRAPGCDKEFKRPCDLTKHEKTHSRPWKCPVPSCKYHEYGWPTEKEMDRHHNDKHSSAPALFECHFKPCPYRSKRESNCKQHMEKAHGWEYVRSKNIGKHKADSTVAGDEPAATNHGLPTPQTTNIQTPSSDGQLVSTPDDDMFDLSYDAQPAMFDAQNQLNFPQYATTEADLDMFAPPQLQLDYSPASTDYNQSSSTHSPYAAGHVTAQDPFQEIFPELNSGVDFSLYDNEDLYSARAQLPTPNHEVFQQLEARGVFETSGVPLAPTAAPAPHISPLGHGNHMLYSPSSLQDMDEGFEDFLPQDRHLANDFQLFPSSNSGTVTSSAPSVFFGEIPKPVSVFPGTTAQELLDFYAATTTAAAQGHNPVTMMDWTGEDQFTGYVPQ